MKKFENAGRILEIEISSTLGLSKGSVCSQSKSKGLCFSYKEKGELSKINYCDLNRAFQWLSDNFMKNLHAFSAIITQSWIGGFLFFFINK